MHKTEEVREYAEDKKTELVYVPGGCTSLAQTLDVSINKPFKSNMRHFSERLAI